MRADLIMAEKNPYELKKLGKLVENLPKWWDRVKCGVLASLDILKVKFHQILGATIFS